MTHHEEKHEETDEPQEDMELPDEQSEDVKGGVAKKAPGENPDFHFDK
jgi:hypothetical protein